MRQFVLNNSISSLLINTIQNEYYLIYLFSWVDFYHVLAVGCVIYHEDHHEKESVLVKIRGVLQILLSGVTIRVFFQQTLTLVQNHLFLSV